MLFMAPDSRFADFVPFNPIFGILSRTIQGPGRVRSRIGLLVVGAYRFEPNFLSVTTDSVFV